MAGLVDAIESRSRPSFDEAPPTRAASRPARARVERRWRGGVTLLLILDQFEEHFLYRSSTRPEPFADDSPAV